MHNIDAIYTTPKWYFYVMINRKLEEDKKFFTL
nr:MAG TPA: hypothetical protein [Caudoviricetes sp.]